MSQVMFWHARNTSDCWINFIGRKLHALENDVLRKRNLDGLAGLVEYVYFEGECFTIGVPEKELFECENRGLKFLFDESSPCTKGNPTRAFEVD